MPHKLKHKLTSKINNKKKLPSGHKPMLIWPTNKPNKMHKMLKRLPTRQPKIKYKSRRKSKHNMVNLDTQHCMEKMDTHPKMSFRLPCCLRYHPPHRMTPPKTHSLIMCTMSTPVSLNLPIMDGNQVSSIGTILKVATTVSCGRLPEQHKSFRLDVIWMIWLKW